MLACWGNNAVVEFWMGGRVWSLWPSCHFGSSSHFCSLTAGGGNLHGCAVGGRTTSGHRGRAPSHRTASCGSGGRSDPRWPGGVADFVLCHPFQRVRCCGTTRKVGTDRPQGAEVHPTAPEDLIGLEQLQKPQVARSSSNFERGSRDTTGVRIFRGVAPAPGRSSTWRWNPPQKSWTQSTIWTRPLIGLGFQRTSEPHCVATWGLLRRSGMSSLWDATSGTQWWRARRARGQRQLTEAGRIETWQPSTWRGSKSFGGCASGEWALRPTPQGR